MVNIRKENWIEEDDLEVLQQLKHRRGSPLSRLKVSKDELDEYFAT